MNSLDDLILACNCPGRNKTFSLFGNRCRYTNEKCLISDNVAFQECAIYLAHNIILNDSNHLADKDSCDLSVGIGACDLTTIRRHYNVQG